MATDQIPATHMDPNDTLIPQLYVLCTLFPALATLFVSGRFLSRRLNGIDLWWDDWTALLALILVWVSSATVFKAIQHGKGRHIAFLSDSERHEVKYWTYWFALWYSATPPTVKASALLLYKRIFVAGAFSKLVTAMLSIVICWGIAMTFVSVFFCRPISAFWAGHGVCIEERKWVTGYGIPNIVFDVIVWSMPIPKVWRMSLSTNDKVSLTIIFALGLADCLLAIIRLSGAAQRLGDPDVSYTWSPSMWWCIIHTSVGIIVISLPTMRVLVATLRKRLLALRSTRRSLESRPESMAGTPPTRKYALARSVGLSLSGEREDALHNNIVALALHSGTKECDVPKKGIQIQCEVTVEVAPSDSDSAVHRGQP